MDNKKEGAELQLPHNVIFDAFALVTTCPRPHIKWIPAICSNFVAFDAYRRYSRLLVIEHAKRRTVVKAGTELTNAAVEVSTKEATRDKKCCMSSASRATTKPICPEPEWSYLARLSSCKTLLRLLFHLVNLFLSKTKLQKLGLSLLAR